MLKYFETLNEIHASSYVKRSDGDQRVQRLSKHLEFTVFQRNFQLTLSSGSSVLSKDFKAHLVDGDGRMKSYTVDQTRVFSGHLTDNEYAPVTAYMEDNFWSIHIFDENETYAIEPARNLLTSAENPENDTYIAYRGTDLRYEDEHCAAVNPENLGDGFFTNIPQMPYWKSYVSPKRDPMDNTCYLYYAADYYFYSRRCRNHHAICTSLMINSLETVDRIFRQSTFLGPYGSVFTDIGFQIGMLVLFVSPSAPHHLNKVHFNARDVAWTMDLKLESFSHWTSSLPKVYCHNHLLTSYLMPKQVLGIAYLNGLCDWRGYINSAVTTDESITGSIPSLMLNLVIAHVAETSTGCLFGGSALGKPRSPAEETGEAAAREVIEALHSGGCVDQYLQDQLILLMTLAKGTTKMLCGPLTLHTQTAIHVARLMTKAEFTVENLDQNKFLITCEGIGHLNTHLTDA